MVRGGAASREVAITQMDQNGHLSASASSSPSPPPPRAHPHTHVHVHTVGVRQKRGACTHGWSWAMYHDVRSVCMRGAPSASIRDRISSLRCHQRRIPRRGWEWGGRPWPGPVLHGNARAPRPGCIRRQTGCRGVVTGLGSRTIFPSKIWSPCRKCLSSFFSLSLSLSLSLSCVCVCVCVYVCICVCVCVWCVSVCGHTSETLSFFFHEI